MESLQIQLHLHLHLHLRFSLQSCFSLDRGASQSLVLSWFFFRPASGCSTGSTKWTPFKSNFRIIFTSTFAFGLQFCISLCCSYFSFTCSLQPKPGFSGQEGGQSSSPLGLPQGGGALQTPTLGQGRAPIPCPKLSSLRPASG
jgi:hypothetical protein